MGKWCLRWWRKRRDASSTQGTPPASLINTHPLARADKPLKSVQVAPRARIETAFGQKLRFAEPLAAELRLEPVTSSLRVESAPFLRVGRGHTALLVRTLALATATLGVWRSHAYVSFEDCVCLHLRD